MIGLYSGYILINWPTYSLSRKRRSFCRFSYSYSSSIRYRQVYFLSTCALALRTLCDETYTHYKYCSFDSFYFHLIDSKIEIICCIHKFIRKKNSYIAKLSEYFVLLTYHNINTYVHKICAYITIFNFRSQSFCSLYKITLMTFCNTTIP